MTEFDSCVWTHSVFFQAEDGIRDAQESRGLGDVYKRQEHHVAMARTHCARVLHEAITKYLGWDLYCHS